MKLEKYEKRIWEFCYSQMNNNTKNEIIAKWFVNLVGKSQNTPLFKSLKVKE